MINLLNLIVNKTNVYHVNELVSRDHREKFDLNSFEERIYRALRSIFGAELDIQPFGHISHRVITLGPPA
ncbi:hypothetical protein [Aeromonas salmonicida]|uniref:hypothetical protein n=1 Tax=Aeromonas salmonicida TaxID=645 RepID=UPI0012D98255|nr:hypothetical protein [Aeromonas salmonicida]MUG26846.1 hypothetical protein [Aeromonas salmonicida]